MTQKTKVGKRTRGEDASDLQLLSHQEFRQMSRSEDDVFRYMQTDVVPQMVQENRFIEALVIDAGLYRAAALRGNYRSMLKPTPPSIVA